MSKAVGRSGGVDVYIGESSTLTTADRLPNVKTIGFPSPEASELDTTDFDSTAKETENGLITYSDLTITQHMTDDASATNEFDIQEARSMSGVKVYIEYFLNGKNGVLMGRKTEGVIKSCVVNNVEMDGVYEVVTTIKVNKATEKVTTKPSA